MFGGRIRIAVLAVLGAMTFAMLFSWSALKAAQGQGGPVGAAALTISTYPSLVREAVSEAASRITGEEDYKHVSVPRPDAVPPDFDPLPSVTGEGVPGFVFNGNPAALDRGWRLFAGAFAFQDGVENAAVLVDPDFRIRRIWRLDEDALGAASAESDRKLVHGLDITRKGDLLIAFDQGASLQRLDACGGTEWVQTGIYHHAVTLDPDANALWALRTSEADATAYDPMREAFMRHDLATGEVLRTITMAEVIDANPRSGLFLIGARDAEDVWANTMAPGWRWQADPFHFNDIDPLPAALAPAYPGFDAGDLLVSSRSLNSIFVLDPDTLFIKWHLTGETQRQHDPDWWPDGRIAIYDNRQGVGPSRILAVDPTSGRQATVVSGAQHDFYSRIRGRHARTPRGDLAIVSPQQGRAFEFSEGEVVAEYFNLGPEGSGVNLALTEFQFIPEQAIDLEVSSCGSL